MPSNWRARSSRNSASVCLSPKERIIGSTVPHTGIRSRSAASISPAVAFRLGFLACALDPIAAIGLDLPKGVMDRSCRQLQKSSLRRSFFRELLAVDAKLRAKQIPQGPDKFATILA